jgi:ATP-binding cassette, subfamily B, bacterial
VGMSGTFISIGSKSDALEAKRGVKRGTAKRMLRFAASYTPFLALFVFVVLLNAAIDVASPLIYREIINGGILKSNTTLIINLAVLVGVLGFLGSALGLGQAYLSAKIGTRIVLSLRIKLFEHIQKMPLAFFMRAQTGALVSRLNTDVNGAQTAFTDVLSNVVGNIITVALLLGAMFTLSWRMTSATLALLLLFIIPIRFYGKKTQEIMRESFDLTAAMNSLMIERFNVAGAQLAKIFGHPKDESKGFLEKATRVSDNIVTRTIYSRLFLTSLLMMSVFATALAYGWGGTLAVQHKLDLGTIVAFVAFLAQLYGPLVGISNIQVSVMTALVSFERVFEVLDLPPMIQEKTHPISIPKGEPRVQFDNVSFLYPRASEVSLASLESIAVLSKLPEKTVLHEITFAAEPGQLVALVGPSGAGKTTITQLIPRLYDVQSGSVTINGIDVRDTKLDDLRERIGTVTQDAHLFHDTIRANLLYAKPGATESELTEALRAAQILPLIESLPNGLDTLVGERGYRFSGGEKQRLAIARLLLKAPDIVILDEATAHLDSGSEAAIQQAFEIALRGRTAIVIAHRLSTILKADQILVMDEGRIVERGTHAELLQRQGLYASLYRRQFEDAPPHMQMNTEILPAPDLTNFGGNIPITPKMKISF